METQNAKKKVILWCTMRSLSTAFLKSVSQLDEVHVLHEPFTQTFLKGPQRLPGVYDHAEVDQTLTYEAAFETLCNDQSGKHLFVKIPSCTVAPYTEMLLRDEIRAFKHVFLIRDPERTLFSYYRLNSKKKNIFDNLDKFVYTCYMDFQAHASIFNFVTEHFDQNPLIIDADDLLRNAEAVMREFCHRVGFTYDARMLKWEPAAIPGTEDLQWNVAFKEAAESSGFKEQRTSADEGVPESAKDRMKQTIEQCQPIYQELYLKRFVPN